MATFGHQRSDDKVVQGGQFIYEDLLAEQDGSNNDVMPGHLVVPGSDNEHVQPAGTNATDVLGVADVIFTERRGQTSREGQEVGTAIPAEDPVRVAKGIFLFRGLLATGENISKGERFGVSAPGELVTASAGNPVYGWFEEDRDNSGGSSPIGVLAMFCAMEVNL